MVSTQLYIKVSTFYIELTSLLLYKINYVIVKTVTPCFHKPSLLSRSLVESILYWKYQSF